MTDTPAPVPPIGPTLGPARGPIGIPRSVGLTILVSIVTLGVWTWVWSYWNGEELKTYRGDGIGGVGYLFLTILVAPVTMFLLANEVEKAYLEEGQRPPVTTMWGLWFLLPLIGQIIWYVGVQQAINQLWQLRGASVDPGLT